MKTSEYDVAIVGAGLVGAALAAALIAEPANQHLSIALIEKNDLGSTPDISMQPPQFDPRVVALTPASMNFLQDINVWERILATRVCPYRFMYVWDDEGTGNIHFSAEALGRNELGFIVENQLVLNSLLEKIHQSQQVDIIRGNALESIQLEKNQQQLLMSNSEVIRTTLLVAADGGQSRVRELANLPVRVWDYQHKAIVTTVKSEKSHRNTAWQNFLSTGPLAFLPLSDPSEQYCSIVWSIENDKADELMALNDNEFKAALANAFEHTLGNVESVAKRFCFPLKQGHAVDYIAPQLVLIGDAAHTIHPLAGQGVNLGLLDAAALSNEITRASQRGLSLADESLLRRYQRQRKKNNLEIMFLMEGFKRLFGSRHIAVRWLRNTGLKSVNGMTLLKNWMAKQAMGLK